MEERYGEILIYQTEDGLTNINVKMQDDTVWLTQQQLVELYQSSKSNVSEHIKHIFEEGELDEESVVRKFRTTASDVALENNVIVGFGDIDNTGYLDRLFVHKDYQSQGIATALCDRLEAGFDRVTTHASITAKQFFMNRGYRLIKEQQVIRNGISLAPF